MFEMFALIINLLSLTISDAMVTCCCFLFIFTWKALLRKGLFTVIFYIAYSRICRGNLPRQFCRGCLLQEFGARFCRENLPQEFPVTIFRENLLQEFAVAICRRNLPWLFAVRICRRKLPWLFPMVFLYL